MVETYLSPKDIARLLNVPLRTVQQLLATGRLPGIRVGRHWRVAPEDFRRWIEQHKQEPPPRAPRGPDRPPGHG